MLKWLRRGLVYFLIPTGLVLLTFPLSTHRGESAGREYVYLEISETLVSPALTETDTRPKPASAEEAWRQLDDQQQALSERFSDEPLLINSYGYPLIRSDDMTPYPAVQSAVNAMMGRINLWPQEKLREDRCEDVPAAEWALFHEAHATEGAFQVGNRIFRGRTAPGFETLKTEVKNLRLTCRVIGGICLVLCLFLCRGLYASPSAKGIQVGRRSAVIIWDTATVLVGIVFAWWLADFALERMFQIEAFWGEDFTAGMGIFWAVLMNPVVALITTALSQQILEITSESVVLKGLLGREAIAWTDVETLRVSQLYSVRKAAGVPAPHRVMKILEIAGGPVSLRIMEPPYAATKKEILAAMEQHAPDKLRDRITEVSKEWLSKW